MPQSLSFLHTSSVHIQTFNALLAELAPDVPARHIVDESLLSEACAAGGVTPSLQNRVEEVLQDIVEQGTAVVVCTCSSIGAVAEGLGRRISFPLLRIDRPMAEEAITRGSRIIVAATLSPTLIPTRELLMLAAHEANKEIQIIELLCTSAWRQFELGNQEAYLREIARDMQAVADQGDIIVLAQASMARAAQLCPDLTLPILTSPRSGLIAALQVYRAIVSRDARAKEFEG